MSNHVYLVQVSRDRGSKSPYQTRYSLTNERDAVFWFRGINVGNGYRKHLLLDGKVIARVMS